MSNKSKILVVDDELVICNSCFEILNEEGYEVETLQSSRVALEKIQEDFFDLIIVDLKMPDMDDFEFLLFMNQNYPHIPVVVTTAFGTPDIESRIKKLEYWSNPAM